ncbi:MAG: diacylglycerol kinase [Streptococcus sp.]
MDLRDNNPQKKWKNREFTASLSLLDRNNKAFKEERNMRKHLVSAILVVWLAIFRVSAIEWLFF